MTDDLFGGPSIEDVRLDDQIDCLTREIDLRQRVYPRWVAEGRMAQADADREILCMRAARATLRRLR